MNELYDIKASLIIDEVTRGNDNSFIDLRIQLSKEKDLSRDKVVNLLKTMVELGLTSEE